MVRLRRLRRRDIQAMPTAVATPTAQHQARVGGTSQTLMASRPPLEEIKRFPSGENATQKAAFKWPWIEATSSPFTDLGLSSTQLARLTAQLEDAMGVEVPLTAIYDHPDIEQLVEYLAMR